MLIGTRSRAVGRAETLSQPATTATRASARKRAIREHADRTAASRDATIDRRRYYYENEYRHLRSIVPAGSAVLDFGCGTGELLRALRPGRAVGVDFSTAMIEIARAKLPRAELHLGDIEDDAVLQGIDGAFDAIILSDTLGAVDDCEGTLRSLHRFCHRDTRIVIAHYSWLWEPVLVVAEWLRLKTEQPEQNWLSSADVAALCELADLDPVTIEWQQLSPLRLLGLGSVVNTLEGLPVLRRLCLRHYVVARSLPHRRMSPPPSLSIVVPCRNERDNVEPAVIRTPPICDRQELLFVEGHSHDGTWEEIERVRAAYPERRIRALRQSGKGKADAVWTGFDAAEGDILMILDGDLTVPPESLPKFYRALVEGHGEYAMGTRMVYPVERTAMRFLNYWANRLFAVMFSWLLRQRVTDTLCGTKVLERTAYERIRRSPGFSTRDPFGDFDLILGAAQQRLKIVEIPIRYAARAYGETQIDRFRHGWMLARRIVQAFRMP